MNETTGKPASCLVVAEKTAHKPGGCVGIFFQLFDWNRRFAKKRLFSKKLLPPARAKKGSNNFGGDEKMPKTKLQFIADENNGGFPNVKKNGNRNSLDVVEHKYEMRAPSLVARLMGLESMPTVHRDKHKQASNSVPHNVTEEKFVNSVSGLEREDVNLERGSMKVESRPQKIQKIGQHEKQAVTRFGPEVLQIKGVLSRSRKHHQPKFAPPVKSPRISSSRNASRASRLIDAATRILEPGLQATNRAKCALTYSGSMNYTPKDEILRDEVDTMPTDVVTKHYEQHNASYNVSAPKSLMGQASCKNCGNFVDVVDSRPNVEAPTYISPSSVSTLVNNSSRVSEIRPRPLSFPEQDWDIGYERNWDQPSIAAETQDNRGPQSQSITEKKPVSREVQKLRQFRNQHHRPLRDEPSSIAFKQKAQFQNEISTGRDRTPPRANLNSLQSRRAPAANGVRGVTDFVSSNRSSGGHSRPRVATKADNSAVGINRKFFGRPDDSLSQLSSPVRKRRTFSVNTQHGSPGLTTNQRIPKWKVVTGNQSGLNSRSMDLRHIKSSLAGHGEGKRANGNKDNDVISFTFNSALRQQASISSELKEKRDQIDPNNSHQRNLLLDDKGAKTSSHMQLPLRGDVLGTLLQRKLKELTSDEEDEFVDGASTPKRSSTMILQEIISALTSAEPMFPNDVLNADKLFQAGRNVAGAPVGFSHDDDHLSPGSVLEATFSNDSFISSSLDGNSGHRLLLECMDGYYDPPQPIENEVDILDSANSRNDGRTDRMLVTDLLNHISRILQSINLAGGELAGSKLTYAKEVILNAELLFGNVSTHHSEIRKRYFIGPFLLAELENLASSMWINLNCLLGFEDTRESYQLRRFLLDCVIEYLDTKFGRILNCGFKVWRRMQTCMNAGLLIQDIREEVRRWTSFVEMIPDEIIEWEMSHSLGKWMDFEVEAFEAGAEIDIDILQTLVEEVVKDLLLGNS